MVTRHAIYWVLLVCFVVLTACNTFSSSVPAQDLTSATAVYNSSLTIDEIPILESAQIQGGSSTQFSFFVPETVYKHRSELFAFYRQKLPQSGWKFCEIQECILPTPTDTEIETYRNDTDGNKLFLQVGVNLMVDKGIQVTLWLTE